ncbi:MAG: hypothetical protein ACKOEC_08960, partial [Acidimicrobiia bacterium]
MTCQRTERFSAHAAIGVGQGGSEPSGQRGAFDWSPVDRAPLAPRLRTALADSDRRVRTEAHRALASHDDDASVSAVLNA